MVEPTESVSGTKGSRTRRQPTQRSSPAPSSRQSLSRQSSKNTTDKDDQDIEMASPPIRPRRGTARTSSVSSALPIKKEEPARRGRRSNKAVAKEQEESSDEEEGPVEDQVELTTSRRRSRSKRSAGNGASGIRSATPAPQEDEDEGGDEVEEAEEDEEDEEGEKISVEKSDAEPEEEEIKEDPEEIEGEVEEAGEAKITKDGVLLGGREYKCRSFKMPDRGDRIYMMSMDPARVLGFRDSYLFFLRNPKLVRVNTTVEERTWMIENGMLMANFKSKLIAVVTARSIFKMFGHRIIKKGRSKVDDYYESRAVEEDTADESDEEAGSKLGDREGSQGANGTHDDGSALGKRKHTLLHVEDRFRQVTDLNWMHESAMAVRTLNTQLKQLRHENPKFLDPHTNLEQVPAFKQPTRCDVTVAPKANMQDLTATTPANTLNATVVSIPRSIGPQVDTAVKVEIIGGAPAPPVIQDPSVWSVIPEEIRKALENAETGRPKAEDNEEFTKFPLSILEGQYQAAFPVHQVRFQQPYRIVLPQSMTPYAHYIHHLHTTQSRGETGPIMEQTTLPGQTSAHDLRLLQWQQQQLLQQQQQQQHAQLLQQQAKLVQQQQQEQANKKPDTPPAQAQAHVSIYCGALLKTGSGYCQRLVSQQGEHCPNHRGSYTSQPGTPPANGKSRGTCGECNAVTAPPTALPTNKPLPCSMSHLNTCKTCSNSFHPLCLQLDTPRIVSAIASYPWQCNDCKLCVVCMEAGDEASLLICDDCDRGWHMSCCDPAIREVPKGEWLCSFCALCHSCRGTESPTTKYKHAVANVAGSNKYPTYLCTYCSNCHDNFSKGRFCPVCLRTYRGDGAEDESDAVGEDENNMVCCDECNRWVHMDCDGELSEEKVEEMGEDENLKYTCPPCAGKVAPLRPGLSSANVPQEAILQSLHGQAAPQAKVCGVLGGKMRVRGVVEYQGKKLGVPEIVGTGVEYERKMVMELTALKNKGSATTFKRKRGRPSTKSPAAPTIINRRASIASSTSSSLSSLTGSIDS